MERHAPLVPDDCLLGGKAIICIYFLCFLLREGRGEGGLL